MKDISIFLAGAAAGILLISFCSFRTLAQSSASLSGRVTDPRDAVVVGATVTLYSRDANWRSTSLSDAKGNYRFERLSPGDYVIEVYFSGFNRSSRTVRVDKDSPAILDIVLEVASPSAVVLIAASGKAQTADEVSKAFTVVGEQEIEQRNELSIGEALRTVAGLRVQQLGGPGNFTSIQMRGLRDSDTAILIDGLRFRDAAAIQGDATSFIEELFVVNTDRLEVVRGSGSSLYGSNAIGGVVNVITNQGGGPIRGGLQLEGGTLGLFRGRAQIAGGAASNRFNYSLGLATLNVANGVNGDVPTRNWSGQGLAQYSFAPGIDLSGRVFGNTAFLQLTDSPYAPPPGVTLPPAGSVVKAVALPLDQQRRLEANRPISPGDATFVPNLRDPDSRRDSNFLAAALVFTHRLNDHAGYRASFQSITTNRASSDGMAGARFEPLFDTRSEFDGRIDTFNLQGDVRLGSHNLLSFGYEFEREKYINRDSDENPDPAMRVNSGSNIIERSHAFFVQEQFRALDQRLQLSGAFRAQAFDLLEPIFFGGAPAYSGLRFSTPQTAYIGDGSVSYMIRSTGTKLRAHIGSGYRAPSLFERFGTFFFQGEFSPLGDPRLRPERSVAVDGGLDQTFAGDRARISATYFYTRLQEVIVFDFSGIDPATDPLGRFGGYRNTGGGLARGIELSLSAKLLRRTEVTTSYTYTKAANRFATSVPGFLRTFIQPIHNFSLVVNQQIGRRIDVTFDMVAYSSYYFPFSGRAFKFAGPVKADLVASYTYPIGERSLRFYGKVENIFDREYFEGGFRTPGAMFVGGMSFRF